MKLPFHFIFSEGVLVSKLYVVLLMIARTIPLIITGMKTKTVMGVQKTPLKTAIISIAPTNKKTVIPIAADNVSTLKDSNTTLAITTKKSEMK